MKKILCVLLALLTVLSMCGCSALFNLVEDLNSMQNALENAEEEKEKELSRGKWIARRYVNSYAELEFTIGSDWRIMTNEEIAQLVGLTQEIMDIDDGDLISEYLKKNSFYDAMATEDTTGTDEFADNIVVVYEYAGLLGSGDDVAEKYTRIVKEKLEKDYSQYTGFSDIFTVEIGGNSYCSFVSFGQVGGIDYVQQYVIRKVGDYMVSAIVSADDYQTAREIFDRFEDYQGDAADDAVAGIIPAYTEDDTQFADAVPSETGWSGSVYTNAAGEIVFYMPDGWTSDSDVDPAVGFDVDSADGFCNVQLEVEDLGLENVPAQLIMDNVISELGVSYDESGATSYEVDESETITIGGDEYIAVTARVKQGDVELNQCIALRVVGSNLVYVIITDWNDNIDDVIACFE